MFGSKKNEGGIPGMGSLSSGPSASARPSGIPGTASTESAPQSAPASYGSSPQLGASTAGPWEIGPWTIRLFVLVFFAAFAVLFTAEERHRLNDPVQKASRGEITAASGESLLRAANLRKALTAAQAEVPRNVTVESVRITPSRVDLTVAQPDGAQYELAVDPSMKVQKDDYPAAEPEGIPFSKIPAAVPERLLGTIERKLGLRPANLDYLLLNTGKDFDGDRDDSWGAYYSKPPLNNDATAELDGTDVRLIGTPKAADRAQMRKAAQDNLRNLARAEQQIKRANYPNEAMRKQSLKSIREARARAEQTLKEMAK